MKSSDLEWSGPFEIRTFRNGRFSLYDLYSLLSRLSTARGLSMRLSLVSQFMFTKKLLLLKWNVAPLIRRGSNFISLQHCPYYNPSYLGLASGAVSRVGQNKVLLRKKNYCLDTNGWRILFCQPKAS